MVVYTTKRIDGTDYGYAYSSNGKKIADTDGQVYDSAVYPLSETRSFAETDEEAEVEEIRYSVRSIIRELKAIDKFTAVRQLLETANYDWDFIGSNYLSSTDSDFQTMMAAIVSQGILTQAELDTLLPKCIWEQTPMV